MQNLETDGNAEQLDQNEAESPKALPKENQDPVEDHGLPQAEF
jgi:hypothetical protein